MMIGPSLFFIIVKIIPPIGGLTPFIGGLNLVEYGKGVKMKIESRRLTVRTDRVRGVRLYIEGRAGVAGDF